MGVVRGDHPVQDLVGVPPHPLLEQPVGHGVPRGLALVGLGGRERVGEDEAPDALRVASVELHRDLAPHGQACDDAVVDAQVVEERDEVLGEVAEAGESGEVGRRARRGDAVAAQVGGDHPVREGETVDLGLPHGVVEGVAVDEEERGAAAPVLEVEAGGVGVGEAHDGRLGSGDCSVQ